MVDSTRRDFLYITVGGSTLLFGCGSDPGTGPSAMTASTGPGNDDDADDDDNTGGPDDDDNGTGPSSTSGPDDDDTAEETGSGESTGEPIDCNDPFEGGEIVGALGFLYEGATGNFTGEGHDARLALDLGTVTEDTLRTPNDDFYVRSEYPDLINPSDPWSIEVSGLVTPTSISIDDLAGMEQLTEVVLLECSGNGDGLGFGLLSAAEWSGVSLETILGTLDIDPAATRVLISGFDDYTHVSTHSTPGAAWVFTLEELMQAGAFLATEMNGVPLPPNHGAPVRLIAPRWYGCCNIKWVNEIRLVDENEASTSQMQEFWSRTHQTAPHALARDFAPATMQQSAMPVRIEKWRLDGEIVYKVVGILWGGAEPTDALAIRFNGGAPEPVDVCPPQRQNLTWTLWSHLWRPTATGEVYIDMEISDAAIPTNRLDSGFYRRYTLVDEV